MASEWPAALDAAETAQWNDDPLAAGLAHLDRLSIDGGPLTEGPPRRTGLIRALLAVLAAGIGVYLALLATGVT